jgi:hypothetical protein
MYLYDGWQSKRRIMQGVDQWIENATPEKIEKLRDLLEEDGIYP